MVVKQVREPSKASRLYKRLDRQGSLAILKATSLAKQEDEIQAREGIKEARKILSKMANYGHMLE